MLPAASAKVVPTLPIPLPTFDLSIQVRPWTHSAPPLAPSSAGTPTRTYSPSIGSEGSSAAPSQVGSGGICSAASRQVLVSSSGQERVHLTTTTGSWARAQDRESHESRSFDCWAVWPTRARVPSRLRVDCGVILLADFTSYRGHKFTQHVRLSIDSMCEEMVEIPLILKYPEARQTDRQLKVATHGGLMQMGGDLVGPAAAGQGAFSKDKTQKYGFT